MDQRAAYLFQILDKIGAPLTSAVTQDGASDEDAAQAVAGLLSKTVQTSIDLGQAMGVNATEAQDDSLRVALAGLSGALIAGQYSKKGRVPEEADLKKITSSLQAVLTFADNFTPDENNTKRLENLKPQGQTVDAHQAAIQYVGAFIPVVEAIAAFPFGQAEQKLIMDVTDRLVKRAVEMREALLPALDADTHKYAELGLLNALARLYSACHLQETEKVMKMDEAARTAGLSIDQVWASFNMRSAMLEALAANLVPGVPSSKSGAAPKSPEGEPVAPPPTTTPPAVPPAAVGDVSNTTAPPDDIAAASAPPPPAAPPSQPPPENPTPPAGNPMAMFAKKPADGEQAETPPPAAPPSTPPAQPDTPPAIDPQAPPPVTPPAVPPAEPPPAQTQSDTEGTDDDGASGQGGGGNPMSFFKKGD